MIEISSPICDSTVEAVQEFFVNGRLLRQINATTLVLLPKCEQPHSIREYQPLAYCNVLLKIITKILATRLSDSLVGAVSKHQGAFVKGIRGAC